jgi:hypothetical protein
MQQSPFAALLQLIETTKLAAARTQLFRVVKKAPLSGQMRSKFSSLKDFEMPQSNEFASSRPRKSRSSGR